MKILITGSRGFVGSTIGRTAVRNGHQVLGISRAAQPAADWPGDYVSADVVSADLSRVVREFQPEALFHAAGTASVGASFAAPFEDLRASLLSWANLLEGVRKSGQQPLILFPSSGAVYGEPKELPIKETADLLPISPYGYHKAACEALAREYAFCFGQRVLVCRLFSLFGEAQRRLLIWELFKQFAGPDNTVWLQGTGEETRDYLHSEDMADCVLQLIEGQSTSMSQGDCRIVNVASGSETRVMDLAKQLGKMINPKKEIRCRGMHRSGDPERWLADISGLRDLVPGWTAKDFQEGLSSCVNAWKGNK